MENLDEITEDKESKIPDEKMQIEKDEYEFMMPLDPKTKVKPFVDRYFNKYYKTLTHPKDLQLCCNQYAFVHTNKLFMIGMAKEHEVIKKNLTIYKISFDVVTKGNALAVKGKRKKGGMKVKPGTPICEVFCENQLVFTLNALVEGYIIEFNENLVKNPKLLTESSESKGYVVIINSGTRVDHLLKNLVPEESYRKLNDKENNGTNV